MAKKKLCFDSEDCEEFTDFLTSDYDDEDLVLLHKTIKDATSDAAFDLRACIQSVLYARGVDVLGEVE